MTMLMLTILLLVVFQSYDANSIPVMGDNGSSGIVGASPFNLVNPNTRLLNLSLCTYKARTRYDIIWSCATTLFICTWVSIHPNVPPPNESHIRSLWKRLKLMFWMYFAPELILVWAVRQWIAARFIERLFRGARPSSGFFNEKNY